MPPTTRRIAGTRGDARQRQPGDTEQQVDDVVQHRDLEEAQ